MSLRSTAQRQSTLSSSNSSQSPLLQQRVQEKRAELESLKQLKDLSGGLVGQIEQLEQKLSTLTDGTEGNSLFARNECDMALIRYFKSCCNCIIPLAQCFDGDQPGINCNTCAQGRSNYE